MEPMMIKQNEIRTTADVKADLIFENTCFEKDVRFKVSEWSEIQEKNIPVICRPKIDTVHNVERQRIKLFL